ncbi:Uu.00g036820.m01.CDS01 [Anthostomella pinea]|uniref:Uu.00g036820.m01.CDS01 n=1 Tax=Anthostomella pinea TaxID=933095 RepID=A0AAI8V9D4_9PEZI|nr:Uu.00g036820.m01.CDS01 [Anthostomella pinea]
MLITEPDGRNGHVSLLILGAGWTSTFLIPLLEREKIKHAATTTDGRDGTIPFKFDPGSDDPSQFDALPDAKTVLITFPLKGTGPAAQLVKMYSASHQGGNKPNFIQLGVTSVWTALTWQDENSPYDQQNARAVAEDELMGSAKASVLSLAGLYGAARQPKDWVDRVVKTKEDLRNKGALHVVHGVDVARAIVALHRNFTPGKRWLLCDMHVYDWWDLVQDWAIQTLHAAEYGQPGIVSEAKAMRQKELLSWVGELMMEEGVRALPRDTASVGRRLDGRGFWHKMGIWPSQGRIR